jgi:hypothetical protein
MVLSVWQQALEIKGDRKRQKERSCMCKERHKTHSAEVYRGKMWGQNYYVKLDLI